MWSYPMKKENQTDPQMQKLADLIGEASIAMLTTEDADGSLRSRPFATLQMDSAGKLWFFTAMSSGKVGEIDQHRKVNLSYANLDKQDYVSISGHARLFRDAEKMKELGENGGRRRQWQAECLERGAAGLMPAVVSVEKREQRSGVCEHASGHACPRAARANATQRLFGLAKALSSGETDRLGEHGTVHRTQ